MVEQRSPKPTVVSSSLTAPAKRAFSEKRRLSFLPNRHSSLLGILFAVFVDEIICIAFQFRQRFQRKSRWQAQGGGGARIRRWVIRQAQQIINRYLKIPCDGDFDVVWRLAFVALIGGDRVLVDLQNGGKIILRQVSVLA